MRPCTAAAKPNSCGATGLRCTRGASWHKLGSAASIHDVQTEKLSGCYWYTNTGWITPDFILLLTTTAAAEIWGVINFPAAIYVNTRIPLQIVVLPNQAKWKQLKSQQSLVQYVSGSRFGYAESRSHTAHVQPSFIDELSLHQSCYYNNWMNSCDFVVIYNSTHLRNMPLARRS